MILAGDLGGTNARLALYDATGRRRLAERTYAAREFRSAGDVIARFLDEHPTRRPSRASLGIAGPVDGQRCVATNLPWIVDARAIARRFRFEHVALHNDMIALAHGCLAAGRADRTLIHGARAPSLKKGVVAVVAPGTGLGECYLVPAEGRVVAMPTEGGHADFAPRSDEEAALAAFARKTFGRVSSERILCGDGLGLVHRFVLDELGERDGTPGSTTESGDPNRRVMALAELGNPAARRAVGLFASLLGAELGNVALRGLTRGGVYLSGGLGAAVARLESARIVEGFLAKGRFRELLEGFPLALVARTDIGLDGSAALAR